MGRPLGDYDLLLSRADGTWSPVRDYSREFTAQCETRRELNAITPPNTSSGRPVAQR
ncbi:hypothetical protein [Mycobacterium sp.]|uniref:hypothetical protein n=1 Tax=Mycobacterium sp. TaxID=1785 RepID=UPI003340F70A